MVYGDFVCERPDEDTEKAPKDPYGAIKLGAELLIQSFQRQFGIEYAIVRPSAVYGPLDSNLRVTGIFLRNAHQGKSLIVNDIEEKLDFTYVEDIAQGIYLAATHKNGRNEIFNVTRGEAISIHELAVEIVKHYPNTNISTIKEEDKQFPEGLIRPIRGALNIDKAVNLLGYKPKFSIENGIKSYVDSWRKIYGAAHSKK